jgi:large subunit ribosomal protein L15
MPLHRRLPKRGFRSPVAGDTVEVRLGDVAKLRDESIDLAVLKKAGLAPIGALNAKVILAGGIERKVAIKGLGVTKGARAAIEKAGGSIEAPAAASAQA